MPRAIELSKATLAEFDNIYDFLAKRNLRVAANVLQNLDAAIQRLADQPRLGRPFVHDRHRLRLLVHGDYLVFYRERPGWISLVRVLPGRQNISDILDEL